MSKPKPTEPVTEGPPCPGCRGAHELRWCDSLAGAAVLREHHVSEVFVLSSWRLEPRTSFHTMGMALDLARRGDALASPGRSGAGEPG